MIEQNPSYCFLDTNILLHFQTFDEVDWLKVVFARSVILVLAPSVLAELNQHKDDTTNEWRCKRARTLVSRLKSLLGQAGSTLPVEIRPSVFLLDIPYEPVIDWATLGLDPAVNDDRLIATIIKFRDQHPSHEIMVVTDDFLAQRKASNYQIRVIDPEDVIAPIERPSDEVSEAEKLKKENQELKSRIPKPQLWFWEDDKTINHVKRTIATSSTKYSSEDEISQQIAEKRQKLQRIATKAKGITSQDEISEFSEMYERYIQRLEQALILKRTKDFGLSVQLSLVLLNIGNTPAIDLEMWLQFPKRSFVVGVSDKFEMEYWGSVEIPKEPVPEWTKVKSLSSFSDFILPPIKHVQPPEPPRPKGPLYDSNDRSIVQFTTPKLRHKENWSLKSLLVFLPPEVKSGFSIKYSMHADNLLNRVEGQLSVALQIMES